MRGLSLRGSVFAIMCVVITAVSVFAGESSRRMPGLLEKRPANFDARVSSTPQATRPATSRVAPELRETIAQRGSADVMIFLDGRIRSSREAMRVETTRVQNEVLAAFAPGELQGLYRFKSVPALFAHITAEQLARLESSSRVVRIGPNQQGSGGLSQSREFIGAGAAQRAGGFSGNGVTVAVLDTGFPSGAADLAGSLVGEYCFCDNDGTAGNGVGCCPDGSEEQGGPGSAEDDNGHGGHVTGIIASAGDNDAASTGIAPGVDVVAIKILDSSNFGRLSDWAKGLDKVLTDFPDVDLINMSLQSGAVFTGDCSAANADNLAMSAAITSLRALDVATITITGNFAVVGAISSPGCIGGSVAVGAVYDENIGSFGFGTTCTDPTTAPDKVTCFSNVDPTKSEFLLAPGCTIDSTVFFWWNDNCGTSMACPHVVGTAALVLEQAGGGGSLSVSDLYARLDSTGVPVLDPRTGTTHPRVNAYAALIDGDGDGDDNPLDNCPEVFNPAQGNFDGDSYGDLCDLCPALPSLDQTDDDHDRVGNPCDSSPNTFAPERLFVATEHDSGPWPGTIFELDRGTRTIVNSFPTPAPLVVDVGLGYSTHRGTLHYTNPADGVIYILDADTGATVLAYDQTSINGLGGMNSAGVCDGGLLTTAPSGTEWLASPLDGSPGFYTGFLLPPITDGQGATGGNDDPVSFDDHAGWITMRSAFFTPASTNTFILAGMGDGSVRQVYRTPTRCIAPGPNAGLDTPPLGDDVVVLTGLFAGPNGICETIVPALDDLGGCIAPGPNGSLETPPVGDDAVVGSHIDPGPNTICETFVPGRDDLPGGIAEYKINALGVVDEKLIYRVFGVGAPLALQDALLVDNGFAPDPDAIPLEGPVRTDLWLSPVSTGPLGIVAIAAGPTDTDGDGVINDFDNCPGITNAQTDVDLDGHGNECDNCPGVFNPLQRNFDGDSAGDACDPNDDNDPEDDTSDCAPFDDAAWGRPTETLDLQLSHSTGATSFSWSGPADPGATSVVYDLLQVSDPADFSAPVCVESDDGSDTTAVQVGSDPASGSFWSYLARAENSCLAPNDLGDLGNGLSPPPQVPVPRPQAPDCP